MSSECPKIPLFFNFSARCTVSHPISISTGSTSSGRRHLTYGYNRLSVPPVAGPIDNDQLDDHNDQLDDVEDQFDDNVDDQPSTELRGAIPELPGIEVVAKPRAKRYQNSVCHILI